MTDQKDISLNFDLTAAPQATSPPAAPKEYKFLLQDATTVEERNATPMPSRAKEAGELTRIYNFARDAGMPVIELYGCDGDPRQGFTILRLEDIAKATLTRAHYELTKLGGLPPTLELCIDPAARQRLRDDEQKAQDSLRKWGGGTAYNRGMY